VRGEGEQTGLAVGRQILRWGDRHRQGHDARRAVVGHHDIPLDDQILGGQAMTGQVGPGVVSGAGNQAGSEELNRGWPSVVAAGRFRLINRQAVPPDGDLVAANWRDG
jgi:hypothetical protein